MNRRALISTGIVGLTGATAGCTKDGSLTGPQPEETEPRQPPGQQGTTESGVIESGTVNSRPGGKKRIEFTVDYSEQIWEDFTLSLVAIPTTQLLGVTEADLSEIKDYSELHSVEYDGERLKDERDYRVERENKHTFASDDESMLDLDTGTYTIGLLVDMESEENPRLLDVTSDSFHVYTTPGNVKKLYLTTSRREIYEQQSSYTINLLYGFEYTLERDDLMPNRLTVSTELNIPKEELEMVKHIHNLDGEDTVQWANYHEPIWSSKYNQSVEYMNRPVVKTIADDIERFKSMYDIQHDETILTATFSAIRTCEYGQDWDTLSEARSVRYPSHYFMKGFGDCKEMGLLGNSILHHLGYDTTLYLYRLGDNERNFYHLSGAVDCELTEDTQSLYEDGTFETADSAGVDGEEGVDFYAFDPSFGRIYAMSRHDEVKSFFTVSGK